MHNHTVSIFPSFRSFGDKSLPFGTGLHAECWAAWQDARAEAVKALALMGVNPPVPEPDAFAGRGHENSRATP